MTTVFTALMIGIVLCSVMVVLINKRDCFIYKRYMNGDPRIFINQDGLLEELDDHEATYH
jgi:hypothetical protein